LAVVAVAPGTEAPADGPHEGRPPSGLFPSPAPPQGSVLPPELGARTTTIDLSGGLTSTAPLPRPHPGAVPLRKIVGARASSGRWSARARRTAHVGGWLTGTAVVGVGLFTLWVLLFSTISGGDVLDGNPLPKPARQDTPAREAGVNPGPATTIAPTAGPSSIPPARSAAASTHGGSGKNATSGPTSGGTASSGSGRNGADDPPGDDAGGNRAAPTVTATSGGGSGSGSGSGGGSGSGSGSGGGSGGGHGADD
jgi:eukaryotic-like serine/threonine-protein kinase